MALEIMGWQSLRRLRMSGSRPALPVIITSNAKLPERLAGVGCMVILHRAGESPAVKLLDALDVIVIFETCEFAARFFWFAQRHRVHFARYRAWCRCGKALTVAAFDCDTYADGDVWPDRQVNLA